MQNYIEQRAVHFQAAVFAGSVVNEAQLSEPVQEKANAGTGGADHLS